LLDDLLVELLSSSSLSGRSLSLGGLGLLGLSGLLGSGLRLSGSSSIRGDLLKSLDRLDGVLLSEESGWGSLGRVDNGLNLIGVDDSGEVGVRHLGGLDWSLGGSGSVHGVELGEGGFSVDDESTHVSSRGKLKKVESLNVAKFNSTEVSESLFDSIVGSVNNKRSTSHGVSSVSHLSLSGSDLLGGQASVDILVSSNLGQAGLGGGGLVHVLNVREDQWNLRNVVDGMTSGHNQSRDGSCGKSGSNGESSLALVDLSVPLSPSLGWGEHSSTSAHVSEGSLSGSLGSSSGNSWNSGDGSSSSPRDGTGLVTGVEVDGVSLSGVLVHVGVNELNNVRSQRREEDSWEGSRSSLDSGGGEDGNQWSSGGGHVYYLTFERKVPIGL